MLRISKDRRQEIVHRKFKSGVSVVEAAKITNPDELAYALRFLTDHFTYKRSKGGKGVTAKTAADVLAAVREVLDTFAEEIGLPVGVGLEVAEEAVKDHGPVSDLPGSISNPFNNTGA